MSRGLQGSPRRHFTLTLEPDLAGQVQQFMQAHGFTSESLAVNALLRMALAATPEDGIVSGDRARAFNEVRHWTITQVNNALKDIRTLLEAMQ